MDPGQNEGTNTAQAIQILLLLTILSVAPSLVLLTTSFVRAVIVLSLARTALGVPQLPPNQVITGLALFITLFVMMPVGNQINETALQPYLKQEIGQQVFLERAMLPMREFMFCQTKQQSLALFIEQAGLPQPEKPEDIPNHVLVPAFVLSELRTAFLMGFFIFIPFLVIDIVVSMYLQGMGMMYLPPVLISLPIKLLVFVAADGWYFITRAILISFGGC